MLGYRHLQGALAFLSMFSSFTMRMNLSVAIVAMIDRKNANTNFPEYDWSAQIQSVILSGFAWGNVLFQIPGGLLAEKFGPRHFITGNLFVSSLFSILTPVAASTGGWGLVFACRFILGLAQGSLYPVTHVLLTRWIPEKEKGRLVTLVYAGGPLGAVLALAVCGYLSTSPAGWPSCFYVFGGLGLTCALLSLLLGTNSPAEDRFISTEERAYIEDSLKTNKQQTEPLNTPWKSIMTSLPVWAVIVANVGYCWSYYIFTSEVPTYLKAVLGYDLNAAGLLSALPFVFECVLCLVFSITSDYLTNNKIISVTFSRKLFNSIGFLMPGAALIGLSYTQDAKLANAFLCIAIGVSAACFVGVFVNIIDLAPNFAGTVYGISNALGNFFACFGPIVVGAIVTDSGSVAQWQIVLFIAAGIYFFTGVIYVVFAEGELQSWNDPPNNVERVEDAAIREKSVEVASIREKSVEDATICEKSVEGATIREKSVERATIFKKSVVGATICEKSVEDATICEKSVEGATICEKSVEVVTISGESVEGTTNSVEF